MYVNLEQNVAYSLKPSESVKLIVQPNGFKFCKTFQQVQRLVFVFMRIDLILQKLCKNNSNLLRNICNLLESCYTGILYHPCLTQSPDFLYLLTRKKVTSKETEN